MLNDRYGNPLSTTSAAARDAYVEGLDLFIGGYAGVAEALQRATDADGGLAMAHLAQARFNAVLGNRPAVVDALEKVATCSTGLTAQETSAIAAMTPLLSGKPNIAYPMIRAHLADYPRDVLLAQTCTSVFGLIGFSGENGREAETLAYTTSLAPHYGDDWWFLSQHAFAQLEVSRFGPALKNIDRAIEQRPDAPHVIHIKSHMYYECGHPEDGLGYLDEVYPGMDRTAYMHCHVSWHVALWAMQTGDADRMWRIVDQDLTPADPNSPPLNVLTDLAAILARAEMHGIDVPRERWKALSDYARQRFPKPGIAFADVHAALAHASAGARDALDRILTDARGPAATVVKDMSEGFGAYADGDWNKAVGVLSKALSENERIGGSRAQRDLVQYALATALLRLGKSDEAQRLLQIQRPFTKKDGALQALT